MGTPTLGLVFKRAPRMDLHGFSDADWASCIDDRRSVSAYCVYLGGNLISWSSKKQQVIARSSTESEYRALALATSELIWIQSLLTELRIEFVSPPVLWCDNMGAGSLATNPVFHPRTKHIEIDMHFVRDRVLAKQLDIRYVDSTHQVADVLTKPLHVPQYEFLKSKLPLQVSPCHLRGDVSDSAHALAHESLDAT